MTVRVTIDSSGVITIPEKLRDECGIRPHDEVILETVAQGILLRPSSNSPIEIYSDERIAEFTSDEEALGTIIPQDQ